jgi:oligopeptide transport system substrate-binding protein
MAAKGTLRSMGRWVALALALVSSPATASEEVLRLVQSHDAPLLDSTRATDTVSTFIGGHIQEGLTRYGPDGSYQPGVAESWELRADGATFHLRKDARWSDGKPVTAHDFVFAWRTAIDPATASEYAFILYPVKNGEAVNRGSLPTTALGVRAEDDRTLVVEFERPCPYFLGLTAITTYYPVREDVFRAHPNRYAATPQEMLYNGPFMLTRWDRSASISLEKNPFYWDARRVKLDRIEIPYITSDANARMDLFADGRVDLLLQIGRDEIGRSELERLPMKLFQAGSVWFLEFNFRPGRPTRNIHLRRAIQLVFDAREFISSVVGIPGTKPLSGIIPSWIHGLEKPFRQEYPHLPVRLDVDEARREIALAKKELGGSIPRLAWLTGDTPFSEREAEYFQWILKTRLGLEVRVDRQIFSQYLAKMAAGEFDIVPAAWVADYDDPMTYADLFASWNENNRGRYASPGYDALVRRALSTADPRARLDLMASAEGLALGEVAFAPLYESSEVYLQSRRVTGVVRRQVGPDPDLTDASVVNGESAQAWSATH